MLKDIKIELKFSNMSLGKIFLESVIKHFSYYKSLGDKTFEQLSDKDFHFAPNESSNSIAIIIQHVSGNMLSRWTDFLTTDGEKDWRNRDNEFQVIDLNKQQLLELWEKGWACCINTLNNLLEDDLNKMITIRSQQLSALDAINRQLSHIPYHVGQIVYIGRMIKQKEWISLSIPKNQSAEFNRQMKEK